MMKLKILPPTLREKKRYIAFKLYAQKSIQKEEVITLIWQNLINIYGEIKSNHVNLWLINMKEVQNPVHHEYKCIIKCRRGYEKETLTCLNSITTYKHNRIAIHTLSTSGTIKTLDKKYDLL